MSVFRNLFTKKSREKSKETPRAAISPEKLMTSQFAAFYVRYDDPVYRDFYISRLMRIGFNRENAIKMFEFECGILRRYDKPWLLDSHFTESWCFGLDQLIFATYPKTKQDILKENYLTMSELCKLIDEAEWHFWNSHEKNFSDEVWEEICAWRIKGAGAEFGIAYFEKIEQETGVPSANIGALSNLQGAHLNRYKWGGRG